MLVDGEHRDLYVLATAPTGGGSIFYKKTNLGNVAFPPGRGTPFIRSAADPQVDNVTSTKQNLSSATGLLALASDSDVSRFYLHNTLDLSGADATAPTVAPPEQDFVPNSTLGTSTVPVKLAWSGTDAGG